MTYLVDLPCAVMFSGGRTSGYLVRKVLEAHGGQPDGLYIIFCNTGLEHPKTYAFIRELEARENIRLTCLEWKYDESPRNRYQVVPSADLSTDGTPFKSMMEFAKMMPNPVMRICTGRLKINPGKEFMRAKLGRKTPYSKAVGLRADEPHRVAKMKANQESDGDPIFPLYHAGATKQVVNDFWASSDYDLRLPNNDDAFGNCVGCFLKGKNSLIRVMQQEPEHFKWWADIESERGATFRSDRPSYKELLQIAAYEKAVPTLDFEDSPLPCDCTE